jgi:hypothetical protein
LQLLILGELGLNPAPLIAGPGIVGVALLQAAFDILDPEPVRLRTGGRAHA